MTYFPNYQEFSIIPPLIFQKGIGPYLWKRKDYAYIHIIHHVTWFDVFQDDAIWDGELWFNLQQNGEKITGWRSRPWDVDDVLDHTGDWRTHHRQRGSDCTVLTATGLVNGEWRRISCRISCNYTARGRIKAKGGCTLLSPSSFTLGGYSGGKDKTRTTGDPCLESGDRSDN